MGWPKRLVLIRHAESEGNLRTADERAGFCVATHAYDITMRGKQQAKMTKKYIQKEFGGFDTHYASYYKRSKKTARIIFPKVHIYEDPRLAEAQRGIYHTMTTDEIARQFPYELKRKEREGIYHYRPLGGENWPDVELRIHSFLGTLARDYEDKEVAMVVHGNWLILFQRLIHHFSIDEALRRYEHGPFENASITVYEGKIMGGKSRLVLTQENVVPWKGII